MIAIMGASGNIGYKIAKNLLGKGEKVKLICRRKEGLQDLIASGGIPFLGDAREEKFLSESFAGCSLIFSMIPPDYSATNMRANQNSFGESIFKAIRNSGCNKVINLSSVGAEREKKSGPIKGLFDQEQRLSGLKGVDIIHLRPTFFLENLLSNLELIKSKGIIGSTISKNAPFFAIATQDIANRALELILNKNFVSQSHQYLLGASETSMEKITSKFSQAIGKKLTYIQFNKDEAKAQMINLGFSVDAANNLIELNDAINAGTLIEFVPQRNHFTPTSAEKFAEEYLKPIIVYTN